jgi:hypothetical protein
MHQVWKKAAVMLVYLRCKGKAFFGCETARVKTVGAGSIKLMWVLLAMSTIRTIIKNADK